MRHLITILLIFSSLSVYAQLSINNTEDRLSVSSKSRIKSKLAPCTLFFSFGNAAISMPPAGLNGTFHPMFEFGLSKPFRKNSARQRLSVGVDAGMFAQKGLQNGVYIKPNMAVNIPIYRSFTISPKLGAGLLLTKNANDEFKAQTDGSFKKMSPLHPQFMGTLGVQPSLTVYNGKKYKYNVFMSYEFAAQTPFSAISSLLPMTMVRLGLKVQPRSNK